MKKVWFAALVAAVLCVAAVAAIEAPYKTVQLKQLSGSAYGTAKYNAVEIESNFYKVGLYQWYTLIDFKDANHITCLGTKKSGYYAPNLGKVAVGADFQASKPAYCVKGKLMLVPSADVSCKNVDGKALAGKMLAWHPAQYLYQI